MILVDTSILIPFFRGSNREGIQKLRMILHQGLPFGINSFIFQEVLQGAASEKEYMLLKQYLETQRFYHLKHPVESFAKAARIYMDGRKKGVTIRSTIDCVIAETALEHDLFLLHDDKDFDEITRIVPLKIYK